MVGAVVGVGDVEDESEVVRAGIASGLMSVVVSRPSAACMNHFNWNPVILLFCPTECYNKKDIVLVGPKY